MPYYPKCQDEIGTLGVGWDRMGRGLGQNETSTILTLGTIPCKNHDGLIP